MRFFLLAILIILPSVGYTQSEGSVDVEALYDDFDKKETSRKRKLRKSKVQKKLEKNEIGTLAELTNLAPFKDVAVIQRRYLPKTGRYEFSGAIGNSLNNAFFNNWGLVTRAGYYFSENYGAELMFFWLNSSERDITESLRNDQSVQTRSLVVPENYLGGSFKWVPIYGKVALFNKRIIPFDLYFSAGLGLSETGLEDKEVTIQFGTGQMYYLTKSIGFRWDFALNSYQARALEDDGTGALQEQTKAQIDLFITVGMSFFWPEATYR